MHVVRYNLAVHKTGKGGKKEGRKKELEVR